MQISVSFFITTGYEEIAEEIIDKIFEYEHYILMKEHLPMYKYVLNDIEEGLKIILTDHNWHIVKLTMFIIYSFHENVIGFNNH